MKPSFSTTVLFMIFIPLLCVEAQGYSPLHRAHEDIVGEIGQRLTATDDVSQALISTVSSTPLSDLFAISGELDKSLGQLRQAELMTFAAHELEPCSSARIKELANTLIFLRRYKDAVRTLNQGMACAHQDADLYILRAEALEKDEKIPEAYEDIVSAIGIAGANQQLRFKETELHSRMKQLEKNPNYFTSLSAEKRSCVVCDEKVPDLIEQLHSDTFEDRHTAAKELVANFSDAGQKAKFEYAQKHKDELLSFLSKGTADQRSDAIYLLHPLGSEAAFAVPDLMRIIGHNEDGLARDAFVLLQAIGAGGEDAVPLLERFLTNEITGCRRCAAATLGKIGGTKAIEVLVRSTHDDDISVRQTAIEALGQIGKGNSNVEDVLLEALSDQNIDIRESASTALARYRTE